MKRFLISVLFGLLLYPVVVNKCSTVCSGQQIYGREIIKLESEKKSKGFRTKLKLNRPDKAVDGEKIATKEPIQTEQGVQYQLYGDEIPSESPEEKGVQPEIAIEQLERQNLIELLARIEIRLESIENDVDSIGSDLDSIRNMLGTNLDDYDW